MTACISRLGQQLPDVIFLSEQPSGNPHPQWLNANRKRYRNVQTLVTDNAPNSPHVQWITAYRLEDSDYIVPKIDWQIESILKDASWLVLQVRIQNKTFTIAGVHLTSGLATKASSFDKSSEYS